MLKTVIDFRGQRKLLRELAYVISKAQFVFCLEGLLNHMASSVNTKSIVIFSGFHPIEIAKYETTLAIVKNPQVNCAPCWLLHKCPKEHKWCTDGISVSQVVDTLKNSLNI